MVKCISCQSEFECAFDDVILVCPKCGAAQSSTGKMIENHYMSCMNIDQSKAKSKLVEWCSNQDSISRDFISKVTSFNYQLIFYPFWVLECEVNTSFQAYQEIAEYNDEFTEKSGVYRYVRLIPKLNVGELQEEYEIGISGIPSLDSKLQNLMIPKSWKAPFDHSYVLDYSGVVLHSKLSEKQAKKQIEKLVNEKQMKHIFEKHRLIRFQEDTITFHDSFLIHVPVWKIEYNYYTEQYESYIDAVSGYIIQSTFPKSTEYNALTGFGLIQLIIGVSLLLLGLSGVFFFGGLISGMILTIVGFLSIYENYLGKKGYV